MTLNENENENKNKNEEEDEEKNEVEEEKEEEKEKGWLIRGHRVQKEKYKQQESFPSTFLSLCYLLKHSKSL